MATRIDFAMVVRLVLKLAGLLMVMFSLAGIVTALIAGLAAIVDDFDYPGGAQTFTFSVPAPSCGS